MSQSLKKLIILELPMIQRQLVSGFLVWLIPFITSMFFFDPNTGQIIIDETFFKTIMSVIGGVVGVYFAIRYFSSITTKYLQEGIELGISWMLLNWLLDLILVWIGFFELSLWEYFSQIGLRYLGMPTYTIGMGIVLSKKGNK